MEKIKGLKINNIGNIMLHGSINDVLMNSEDINFVTRKKFKDVSFIKFAYLNDQTEVWAYINNSTEEILSISASNSDIRALILENETVEYTPEIFNKIKESGVSVKEYVSCARIDKGAPVETKDPRVCNKCTLVCGFRQKALETIADFGDRYLICTEDGAFVETDSTLIDKKIYEKYIA